MKNLFIALLALGSISAFADQQCKTFTPNNDPFGKAWISAQQGDDSYTFCADVDGAKLSNLTVQHNFGGTYPVEASHKNAKHFCKVLVDSKVKSFEKSNSVNGVSLFAAVTSRVTHVRGASYSTIEAPDMNTAFESVDCSK